MKEIISDPLSLQIPFPNISVCFSPVRPCTTVRTVAPQAPLSVGILQARILANWEQLGCYARLQRISPTQGSNHHPPPGLLGLLLWQAGSSPIGPPGNPSQSKRAAKRSQRSLHRCQQPVPSGNIHSSSKIVFEFFESCYFSLALDALRTQSVLNPAVVRRQRLGRTSEDFPEDRSLVPRGQDAWSANCTRLLPAFFRIFAKLQPRGRFQAAGAGRYRTSPPHVLGRGRCPGREQ